MRSVNTLITAHRLIVWQSMSAGPRARVGYPARNHISDALSGAVFMRFLGLKGNMALALAEKVPR